MSWLEKTQAGIVRSISYANCEVLVSEKRLRFFFLLIDQAHKGEDPIYVCTYGARDTGSNSTVDGII